MKKYLLSYVLAMCSMLLTFPATTMAAGITVPDQSAIAVSAIDSHQIEQMFGAANEATSEKKVMSVDNVSMAACRSITADNPGMAGDDLPDGDMSDCNHNSAGAQVVASLFKRMTH